MIDSSHCPVQRARIHTLGVLLVSSTSDLEETTFVPYDAVLMDAVVASRRQLPGRLRERLALLCASFGVWSHSTRRQRGQPGTVIAFELCRCWLSVFLTLS